MSNIDWSQLRKAVDIADEAEAARLAPLITTETEWSEQERKFVGDQLEAMEDGADDALPGTEREWRDYRTQLRAWKEGAKGYPDLNLRPVRPA